MESSANTSDRSSKTKTLFTEIRDAIIAGRLAAGDRLPPSRELATERGVSRHTVTTVYQWLVAEGYIEGRKGVGSFVSAGRVGSPTTPKPSPLVAQTSVTAPEMFHGISESRPRFDLRTGRPDPKLFPLADWRRCVTTALQVATDDFPPQAGLDQLRRAIVRRIAISRGIEASPSQVVVTSGAQQAIDMAVRLLMKSEDVIAVEEPGYPPAVRLFEAQGLTVVPIPVDGEGLIVDQLPLDARMVYTTPSHQSPTGVTMSFRRRQELLAFADTYKVAVLEDDYDSEYRHYDRPLEPLHRLDRSGRVIYIGTFSKVLSPTLRLGFAVFPESLVQPAATLRSLMDWQPSLHMQTALFRFIADGYLDRHIRKTRAVYRQRHECVSGALDDFGNEGLVVGSFASHAGLHVAALLPSGVTGRSVCGHARSNGVELSSFEDCWYGPVRSEGIVVGFGVVDVDQLPDALAIVRGALISG